MNEAEHAGRIEQMISDGLNSCRQARETDRFEIVGSQLLQAHALLRRGDQEGVEKACRILESVLETQERSPRHPHHGNWPRFAGDAEVSDLNSAPFILMWLLPLLFEHSRQVPRALVDFCRQAVQLAVEEVDRLAVAPAYTNIHLMRIGSLLIGGEWLEEERFRQSGKTIFTDWVRFTASQGAPREYNSAIYMAKDLTVLAKVGRLVSEPAVRLQAYLMYERIWLDVALRFHRPTRQLAGPHARCYWNQMISGRDDLKEILWRETGWNWVREPGPYSGGTAPDVPPGLDQALTAHSIPEFAAAWLDRQVTALPYEVRENASREGGHDLTTYLAQSYCLGVASRTYDTGTGILAIEQMANHFLLHYARPGRPGGWGMVYSRYVVNDRHWGTLGSFSFRPKTNFFDQGNFAGLQQRNKAICLYALRPLYDTYITSLKTVVVFQSGRDLDCVWVHGQPLVPEESTEIEPGDWLIVEDGAIYVGIYPLKATCLGREAPIRWEHGPQAELFLSIYNYRGAEPKRLWDYASLGGPYWRGNLRAGFLVEVAERAEYDSPATFLSHLRQAEIEDAVTDSFIRTVTFQSGDDTLSLDYDLWHSEPKQRRINGAVYQPPSLASPLAVQGESGELRVGSVALATNPQPVWLIAQEIDPSSPSWVAVNPEDRPTPLRLDTPCGIVRADEWGLGRLEWRAPDEGPQELHLLGLEEPAGLRAPEGVAIHYQRPDVWS